MREEKRREVNVETIVRGREKMTEKLVEWKLCSHVSRSMWREIG